MEIEEALERYQVQLEADGRSVHTRRQYARHGRLLARWLRESGGSTDVRLISHEDIATFLIAPVARTRPDGKPKKATATNALRSSLRTLFAFVHAAGYAPTNAARLIRRARCAPPPPRGLSEEEQERLLAALVAAKGDEAERDRVLFDLMLATGIRLGSVLALDIEDVNIERGELYLRRTKGDRPFAIFFNERVAALLRGHIGELTAGPLFESRQRRRLSVRQVQRRLSNWLQRAACRPAGPHALRHTFGQTVYDRTRDPLVVQAALGHRSIASTMVYAQVDERRLRAALG